jgi:hypothetical protein
MPVQSTHADYDASLPHWLAIRDVLTGENAIKRGGEKYVPRLESQSDDEFAAYVQRGFFYNATARTVDGYLGLIFRRDPVLVLPGESSALHPVLYAFVNDVDLRGTMLDAFARHTVSEVISVGRCASLIDWQEDEDRAYASHYPAESILNWRESRINGRMQLSLVVVSESVPSESDSADPFLVDDVEQIRVLRLVPSDASPAQISTVKLEHARRHTYTVELWQRRATGKGRSKDWALVRSLTPLRRGQPLDAIPFVFHGPTHSRAAVEKSPIADLVAANLDHYRLNVDYKHGMHFTALPTAFVSGFEKDAELRIGSTTAWTTETVGATAGFLEFKGEGLGTFEKALDRVERLMTVLGSRLLETQKRVSESAEALALRQAGESSIIGCLAVAVTASLNDVLRWVYWWHSTEALPEDVSPQHLRYELNTDFEASALGAKELTALVAAWQQGAISRDTLLHNLRAGELLPPARTNEQELALIAAAPVSAPSTINSQPSTNSGVAAAGADE